MAGNKNNGSDYQPFSVGGVMCACFGILTLAMCYLCIEYTDFQHEKIILVHLGIYAGIVVLVLLINIIAIAISRKGVYTFASAVTQSASAKFLQKLTKPVIICDEKGKIVWYNQYLREICGSNAVLYNKYIDSICDSTLERIVKSDDLLGTDLHFTTGESSERLLPGVFNAVGYEIEVEGRSYFMAIFTDVTALKTLERRIRDEDTYIGYAMIDNLEELLQYIQEGYGRAAEEVEKILEKYFQGVGGFVREYGNNRFMCVFEAQQFTALEADRFSLLDDVRDIRLGETTLSVTLSMGIAKIEGTLLEKERAAQAALDMALQRGGDQVVVKAKDGVEFFGGKTKAVQKRTKVRSRVIANELIALISMSGNVIIMGHRFPDADSFASCIAVARIARFCGATAHIVIDQTDKNLKNCFKILEDNPDYSGIFVDRAQAQDLMESGTLVIVTDVNNMNICEAPDIVKSAEEYIVIDHHRKTSEFAKQPKIGYIEPSASSASELMSELLELILPQGTLPKAEADLLFAGMLLDTKQFTHNTGVRTFGAALYLRNEGASPLDANALFKTDLDDFLSEAQFESNVSIYRDIVAIALNEEDTSNSLTRVNAAKAADRLLSVEGIRAAFAVCSIDKVICISARSDGTINVQRMAEKLGGGGHFDSAGVQLRDVSIKEAIVMLRAAIDEILDNPTE
jgi:c-di-AMP phosphodiesterase-like protein